MNMVPHCAVLARAERAGLAEREGWLAVQCSVVRPDFHPRDQTRPYDCEELKYRRQNYERHLESTLVV
eukprot:195352-Rhodomonas_salina.1